MHNGVDGRLKRKIMLVYCNALRVNLRGKDSLSNETRCI